MAQQGAQASQDLTDLPLEQLMNESKLIDASIVEDQAFAFGLLPREEMAAIYAARNALELTKDRSSVTRPSARGAS
jgi:hypothetical protein